MSEAMTDSLPQSSVLDVGDGPAVLLLHGTAPGTTADANFNRMIPALGGYRVLAPDLIGFGDSAKPVDLTYGPRLWTRQAWQILDERELDQVVVVGNSMGARVALSMALEQPDRIAGLVLLSTRLRPSQSHAQRLLRDYVPSPEAMEQLLRECFVTDQDIVTPALVRQRYEVSARPGAHEAMQSVFAGLAAAGPGHTDEELESISVPTLILHGREDRVVPAENSVLLAQHMPHADLHLLSRTGHWLQIERAGLVNALINRFLTECTR